MPKIIPAILILSVALAAAEPPLIFPAPQKSASTSSHFRFTEAVPILIPDPPGPADLQLAREIAAEAGDRFGIALRIERTKSLPAGPFVLMGDLSNPLVRRYCAEHKLEPPSQAEGYALHSTAEGLIVAGRDEAGAFYGMQSVRQMLTRERGQVLVRGDEVHDWPRMPFRAIRLYLPGHENIAFFHRFLRDFMALYKFNKVVLEVNASMRLDSHPELNAGWLDFARDLFYTQRYYPLGPRSTYQNSAHHDTADGEILEKDEVAGIVRYAASQHIEVIPEIPTFTHSYFWLTRHKDLAAIPGAEWPDVYDPTKPEVYKLVFDVLDEYIDVMKPKMIHIGHDEMFFPLELCTPCQTTPAPLLWAQDIRRIHDHLAARGVKTAIYADHLIESVRGVGRKPIKSKSGWEYNMPGALTPQQVADLIPKDILMFNWFWQDARAADGRGEANDIKLSDWGFQQVHNNFMPDIQNYARRSVRAGVIGGVPSAWAATNEYTFGKDLMIDYLGTINLMWSTAWPTQEMLARIVQTMMPGVRRRLSGKIPPSETGDPVSPISLSSQPEPTLPRLRTGGLLNGAQRFEVGDPVVVGVEGKEKSPYPMQSAPIAIGADVSSIIFLHATTRPAANDMSYRYIHNFADTSDLLGWYDVVYEDGFVDTVPIRFGWNILPLTWCSQPDTVAKGSARELTYAYAADLVPDDDVALFAYEWVNPRFGKVVREVRLHGTSHFIDSRGTVTPTNAIVLAGVSVVRKRVAPSR